MLVKPFLKFPGGKAYLADTIISHFPKDFNQYYEPMIGGGAIFFEMVSRSLIKKAFISDINPWLMSAYYDLREEPQAAIAKLISLRRMHKKYTDKYGTAEKFYYRVRKYSNRQMPPEVAFTIYLNKTCFNGLFRFNQKGQFNAPVGDQKHPALFDTKNILNISAALNKYVLFGIPNYTGNFKAIKKNDLVYLDPPYWPIKESSFTSYTQFGFSKEDHIRLAKFARDLREKKAYVVLSNSDVPEIRDLYKGFNIVSIKAPRRINRDGKGRGNVSELIIKSF